MTKKKKTIYSLIGILLCIAIASFAYFQLNKEISSNLIETIDDPKYENMANVEYEILKHEIQKLDDKDLYVQVLDIYSDKEISEEQLRNISKELYELIKKNSSDEKLFKAMIHVYADKKDYEKSVEANYDGNYGLYITSEFFLTQPTFSPDIIRYIDVSIAEESSLDAIEFNVIDSIENKEHATLAIVAKGSVTGGVLFIPSFIEHVKELNPHLKDFTLQFFEDRASYESSLVPAWEYRNGMLAFRDKYEIIESALNDSRSNDVTEVTESENEETENTNTNN